MDRRTQASIYCDILHLFQHSVYIIHYSLCFILFLYIKLYGDFAWRLGPRWHSAWTSAGSQYSHRAFVDSADGDAMTIYDKCAPSDQVLLQYSMLNEEAKVNERCTIVAKCEHSIRSEWEILYGIHALLEASIVSQFSLIYVQSWLLARQQATAHTVNLAS